MNAIVTFYSTEQLDLGWLTQRIVSQLDPGVLRILVVDWNARCPDLSAHLLVQEGAWPRGLFDLLADRKRGMETSWRDYLAPSRVPGLSFLPVGDLFLGRTFDWDSFYANHRGGAFLEHLRHEWLESFEVIIINSPGGDRTASQLCAVQMADVLALVFYADQEQARRAGEAVQLARKARQQLAYDRMPLLVYPLPLTRVQQREPWLDFAVENLARCYNDWLPKGFPSRSALDMAQVRLASESENRPHYQLAAQLIGNDFKELAGALVSLRDQLARAGSSGEGKGGRSLLKGGLTRTDSQGTRDHDALASDILLVESDADNRELLQELLEAAGYRVICAGTAVHARAALADRKPALVLLELALGLPGGGRSVLHFIRETKALSDVPVYLLVRPDEVADLGAGRSKDRIEGVLEMPLDVRKLLDTVQRWCGRRSATGN